MNWYKQAEISYNEAISLLNLPSSFSAEDLKKQYRKLIREWHPDVNKNEGAQEMAQKINHAYSVLNSRFQRGTVSEQSFGDIDVPDFMQKEPSMRDFFINNMDAYIEQVINDVGIEAGVPGQSSEYFGTGMYWMSIGIIMDYIARLVQYWNMSEKRPKITADIRQELFTIAYDLYNDRQESLRNINKALAQYLKNWTYKKPSFWDRIKPIFK